MTSRSNFLKLHINHGFLAAKHTQPTEDLGVPLVISSGHHPKVRSWGQLFSMIPGGSAVQQGLLRNAWYDCEHKLVPCQPADSGKHVYILEKKRPMRRRMSAERTLSWFFGKHLPCPQITAPPQLQEKAGRGLKRCLVSMLCRLLAISACVTLRQRQWETLGVPLSW